MTNGLSFVPDTNVMVSRLLFRRSVPAQAMTLALEAFELLISEETLKEVEDVIFRAKFDRYVTRSERLDFITTLRTTAKRVEKVAQLVACRDPKDDKFLALASAGSASLILTGDDDLLALHPFRGIDIVNPRQFLDRNQRKATPPASPGRNS